MRFAFTEDQRDFADALRAMLSEQCSPSAVRAVWDDGLGHDASLWARLVEMGVIGMLVSEDDGGLGGSMVDAVLLFQELGRAIVPGPVIESMAIVGPALAGTPWARQIANGETVATAALDDTEHVPHTAVATAMLTADGLVDLADAEVTDAGGIDGGRLLGIVDGGRAVDLGDTVIDVEAARDRAALATAAYLIGAAEAMIDLAGEYARQRHQFGKPIGSFQAVKHLLADALLKVEFAKAPTYRAAWSLSVGEDTVARDVSMAKALANEAAHATSRAAMQVHGAIGYTWEADLQLWMKKVWALERAYGTTTWHRRRVSAAVLG